jgi:hypothetical protein
MNGKNLFPHLVAVIVFLLFAVVLCSPALGGKEILQSDVVQWKGMAQQSLNIQEQTGEMPLWTNSGFSGMPAYQIAMESRNRLSPGILHQLFQLFLPKPISFFFLVCISFYFLTQCFRVNPWIGILGAMAYGYGSYNAVIVAVGHDTKMLAMCYMPALLGALILLYEKRYWLGAALTALFTLLMVGMNHPQISYYFLLVAGFMTIGYLYHWIREKQFRHTALALSIAVAAGLLGVMANATSLFVTYDYSKATIRGGTLSLDTAAQATVKKSGLSVDYAFNWSYGKTETFTLLFPALYGGSTGGELDEGSEIVASLQEKGVPEEQAVQYAEGMPTYWGPQPGTSGPVYLGAIVCFLFLWGMVYLKTWHKWWLLAVSVLAIVMSWGNHFEVFNRFLFNYLPLYNKFRAPTMILVIPQLCFPIVAVLVLQRFFFGIDTPEEKKKAFRLGLYLTAGFLLVGALLYFSFDYRGANDEALKQSFSQALQNEQAGTELYSALRTDRQSLFGGDLMRSILLIALAAGLLALALRNRIGFVWAMAGLVLLNAWDLIGVSKRYLNEKNFVDADQYDAVFLPTLADQQIKRDTGYYRVFNLTASDPFADAITSYHHNSIGGYHPAKLSIYEDLMSFQVRKQPMNMNVLNMLNTRYFIVPDQQGQQPVAQRNEQALGNVWLVRNIEFENGPAAVMRALDRFNPQQTAIIDAADKAKVPPITDSSGNIQLLRHTNDDLWYRSSTTGTAFAVFSEVFYDRGWKAYIDGKEAPILRTNYALRGLSLPAGQHEIRFVFHPESYYTGETVSLIAGILIWALLLLAAFQLYRGRKTVVAVEKKQVPQTAKK